MITITAADEIENMEAYLGKKYKVTSSKKFNEWMQHMGIDLVSRKAASAVTTTYVLDRGDDGTYTYQVHTIIRNHKVQFKLGEEFIETRPDGVKVKSIMTLEGNVLKQTQEEDNGRKTYFERVFTDDLLIITITSDGWNDKCIRTCTLVK